MTFKTVFINSSYKIIFLMLISASMVGCATLNKQDCLVTDWYELGLNDGWNGGKLNVFDDYQKSCNKYNIEPNRALYIKGRNEGLISYCTPSNGFKYGLAGRHYNNACLPPTEVGFLTNYEIGSNIYDIRRKIQKDITDLKHILSRRLQIIKDDHSTFYYLQREHEFLKSALSKISKDKAVKKEIESKVTPIIKSIIDYEDSLFDGSSRKNRRRSSSLTRDKKVIEEMLSRLESLDKSLLKHSEDLSNNPLLK